MSWVFIKSIRNIFIKYTCSFLSDATIPNASDFGEGAGRIWSNSVQCNGSERKLTECTLGYVDGISTCTHAQDVTLRCSSG